MSQTKNHCEPLVAVWVRPSTTEPCICCKQVAEKPLGEHLKIYVCMYVCMYVYFRAFTTHLHEKKQLPSTNCDNVWKYQACLMHALEIASQSSAHGATKSDFVQF